MNGIIYQAYNKVTGKCYIGQTVNSLKVRISSHYSAARKPKYHFMYALKAYNKTDWEWNVIEEVDEALLDESEIYWIQYYNSYKNGYNSNYGGKTAVKPSAIHSLYHPEHGIISGTLREIMSITGCAKNLLCQLKKGDCKQYKGWVLSEHAVDYYTFLKRKSKIKVKVEPVKKISKHDVVHTLLGEDNTILTGTLQELADVTSKTVETVDKLVNRKTKKLRYNNTWYRIAPVPKV